MIWETEEKIRNLKDRENDSKIEKVKMELDFLVNNLKSKILVYIIKY
jgi:hypothetical protein